MEQVVNSQKKAKGRARGRAKDTLVSAYEEYKRNPTKSNEGSLYRLVLKFAKSKVVHLEHEFAVGTMNTADDYAQEIAINVWTHLPAFSGDSESFYAWVHKIAFNQASAAFNELKEEQDRKAPLLIETEDEDGEKTTEDNPAIYAQRLGAQECARVDTILEQTTGTDHMICLLIMDGRPYAEIGKLLSLTENAVKLRVRQMRERFKNKGDKNATSEVA